MVNLNNAADAVLLGRAADRDRLARALAVALADHFGQGGKSGPRVR
jgi:N-acetylmuramoyl-L-alanine amidase